MKLYPPLDNVGSQPLYSNGTESWVSQEFGENPQKYAQLGLAGHDGRDYAAPKGTPVKATHDGFVIESIAKDTGYGIRVQIYNEQGYTTIYGHFERSNFPDIPFSWQERRYPVKTGDVIGFVDSTGFSTGNHLHLGLRFYDNYQVKNYNNGFFGYVDPRPYLEEKGTMKGYKVKDNPTVYILLNKFVPITVWQSFLDLGGSEQTIQIISQVTLDDIGVAKDAKFGI